MISDHLQEQGMRYAQHLRFTVHLCAVLLVLSCVTLIHGIMPFIWTKKVSSDIGRLHHSFQEKSP